MTDSWPDILAAAAEVWGHGPRTRVELAILSLMVAYDRDLLARVTTEPFERWLRARDRAIQNRNRPKTPRPSKTRDLIDALERVPVAEALAALGCKPTRRRDRMGPCPACGGADVLVGSRVWRCFRCDASRSVPQTFHILGGGSWEGAAEVADRVGLWRDVGDVAPVVRYRPKVKRPPLPPWLDEVHDAGVGHELMWSWVDRALAREPAFRAAWESDVRAAAAATAPPGTPSEPQSDPAPPTGSTP